MWFRTPYGSPVMPDAASAEAIATTPAGTPAQPTPSRRAIIGRALVLIGVLVVVFGLLLPRLIDFGDVRDALAALTAGQLAILGVTSAIAYVAAAGPSRILVPGLSWPRAVGSDLAARAVVSTVPGPTDIATRYLLYRQWSIPTAVATSGIVFAAMFETFSILALPPLGTGGVLLSGDVTQQRRSCSPCSASPCWSPARSCCSPIVRSEGLARRLGGWLDRVAQRLWALVRTATADGHRRRHARPARAREGHAHEARPAGVHRGRVAKLAWCVVLEVALWCVGVGPDVLAPSAVLATMAVVGIATLIPITPGAVGVTEVAYIGLLTGVAGPGITEQLTAAILLFRISQWLVPIPIGWVPLIVMRRGHWGGAAGRT